MLKSQHCYFTGKQDQRKADHTPAPPVMSQNCAKNKFVFAELKIAHMLWLH